jgi:uncharacterized protein YfkK (UPF0435 family)
MKLKKLKLELEKLQIVYQNLINASIPKSGDLSELTEDGKLRLIDLRNKLRLLREKIFELEDSQPESEEYLKYLEDLKNKFTDEIPPR